MDPFSPINGISLELYAELGADITNVNDPEEQARIVAARGIQRGDWEAAKAGWTARMQDMSLMGRVATAYMPLYQAALGRKSGGVSITFEEYVALCAAAKVWGLDRTLQQYGIDMGRWTQLAGQWNQAIPREPQRFGNYGMLVEQEAARLAGGGPLRPVNVVQAAAPQQQQQQQQQQQAPAYNPAAPFNPTPAYQAPATYNSGPAAGYVATQQDPAQQAMAGLNSVGQSFGAAFGLNAPPQPIGPGMNVLVQWSDGNRYPGMVVQVAQGQYLIALGGQQHWVPQQYVSLS